MRNVTDVITPVKDRRTEYYALYLDQIKNREDQVLCHGPFASVGETESVIKNEDPSSWVIVTKVKVVRVTNAV